MNIHFSNSQNVTIDQFIDVLRRSTLGERRPLDSKIVMTAMLDNASLICTAWDDTKLVGIARSLTDFEYCCYLSDLAVDETYQRVGIGRGLIELTQNSLGETCKLILLAAPKARDYYPRIGFDPHGSAWIIDSRTKLLDSRKSS